LAACLALVLPATATAATVRVTGEKIDGLGEAIIAAEPGDTILIPAGEYLLTEGDVLEEKDLTLRGAGESQTTVVPSGGGDALNDPGVRTLALSIGAPLKPPEDVAADVADPEESASIDPKARIIALIATLGIFGLVLELVRRRRLVERYALLWMSAAVAMLVLSIWTGALDIIANLMGIAEPANAIFSLAFGVAFLLLLNFSVVSSRLSEESKVLAQEVARLEQELRLERSLRGGEGIGFSKPPGGSAGAEDSQDEPPVRAE